MQVELSGDFRKKLMEMIRKKLKASGGNSISIDNLWLEASDEKLAIHFVSNKEVNIPEKAMKNLCKEIADFLFKNGICKRKYSNSQITTDFMQQSPAITKPLRQALSSLKANMKTLPETELLLSNCIERGEVQVSLLMTIMGDYIWPELYGKNIDSLYKRKMYELEPKFSVESNACSEARFLFNNYKKLVIRLRDFSNEDIISFAKNNKDLPESEKSNIQVISANLIKLHSLEFTLTKLWEEHEYLLSRFEILSRVCNQIEGFYVGLSSNDVEKSLWQERELYTKELPAALTSINGFIQPFIQNINIIENTIHGVIRDLNYHQRLGEAQISPVKLPRTGKKETTEESIEAQGLPKPELAAFEHPYQFTQVPNQPSPEKKEALDLAASHSGKEERKQRLKEEKKLLSPKSSQEQYINKEVGTYHFYKNKQELLSFTLEDEHIQLINSELKFYFINHGLIEMSAEFMQVLLNKQDRQFLEFSHVGKSGLKLLRENIIAIKPKTTDDRMLLISINHNNFNFFVPAEIISHQQWESYAAGHDKERLETLIEKVLSTFSITFSTTIIKIKTPEKSLDADKIPANNFFKPKTKTVRTLFSPEVKRDPEKEKTLALEQVSVNSEEKKEDKCDEQSKINTTFNMSCTP